MQLSNIPAKLVLPFANGGSKNSIPVASQIGITAGAASLTDGFPPLTMTPVAAGGVPPSGLDMNGILYEMSNILRWANAGGGYAYDSTFANDSNVGGYPKGARVMRSDGMGYWFNTVENNVTAPEAAGAAAAGWVPDYQAGATSVEMSGSSVTLTPAQYGKPLIVITGALSANLNLVFPSIVGKWIVVNNTTGNYSITAKTESGTGVNISAQINELFGDAVNIYSTQTRIISPKLFGAIGGGVADDTIAVIKCFAFANANTSISDVIIDDVYLCDFLNSSLNDSVLANITRDSLTISGGGTIKVKPNTYTAGVANGDIKIYTTFNLQGNNCTVQNITLDVNDQSTNYVHSEILPNLEFRHTYMFSGTNGVFRHGNKAIGNRYLNGNGQTFVGNYQEQGVISQNYSEGSIGAGWNASRNCILSENNSINARDAHFAAWLSTGISLIGNNGVANSNGNGLDISGSSDIVVLGNTIRESQNCGIWVGRDPNVGTVSQGVLIVGNTLSDNQLFALSSGAEIRVANISYDSTIGPSAVEVLIEGNRIYGDKRAIYLGDLVKDIKILNNSIEPSSITSPFPSSRIDIQTTNKVVVDGNVTTSATGVWNDTVSYAGSNVSYSDPVKRNYHRSPNGGVTAGGAGRYNDIVPLTSSSRHIGRVLMTNQFDRGVIKVKIAITANDKLNYREQEMIFYGGNASTPTQDATTRTLVGVSAATGWGSTITATPSAGGIIDFYATTSASLTGYIDYDIVGNDVTFVKPYNL